MMTRKRWLLIGAAVLMIAGCASVHSPVLSCRTHRTASRAPARTASSRSRSSPPTLMVEASFVYEHAVELGAMRLGSGPRARLRFDLEDVVAPPRARDSGALRL